MSLRALLIAALGSTVVACATPTPRLFLARHGQTRWNQISRFQGDPDLDPTGYLNRISLWQLMQGERLAHIFTSTKQRTARTAELVARQKRLPLRKRAGIDEIDSGVLTGICRAQMEPGYPIPGADQCAVPARGARIGPALAVVRKVWRKSKGAGSAGKVPQGESYRDMRKRAEALRPELMRALDDGQVLVVGHGLINRVFLSMLSGWPLAHVRHLRQENDQVYRFDGLGTHQVQVALYTPGHGWKRCTPPRRGQRRLDCNPGPSQGLQSLASGLAGSR